MANLEILSSLKNVGQVRNETDLGATVKSVAQNYRDSFTTGTGYYELDILYTDTNTLEIADSITYDLVADTFDDLGNEVNAVWVNYIIVFNKSTVYNDSLTIFGGSNGIVSGILNGTVGIVVPGSGLQVWNSGAGDGIAVVPTTAMNFKVTNNSSLNEISYDLIILGRSA